MTGWSEIMSDGMRSILDTAKTERVMEAWTSQIDEGRSLWWSFPTLKSQGEAKLGNVTLNVLLSWTSVIDELPPDCRRWLRTDRLTPFPSRQVE